MRTMEIKNRIKHALMMDGRNRGCYGKETVSTEIELTDKEKELFLNMRLKKGWWFEEVRENVFSISCNYKYI